MTKWKSLKIHVIVSSFLKEKCDYIKSLKNLERIISGQIFNASRKQAHELLILSAFLVSVSIYYLYTINI